jgi:hypothetical protein
VNPNGALTALNQEPRARIKPPFDVTALTDPERNAKLEKRKLKLKIEEVDDKNLPHVHHEKKTLTRL